MNHGHIHTVEIRRGAGLVTWGGITGQSPVRMSPRKCCRLPSNYHHEPLTAVVSLCHMGTERGEGDGRTPAQPTKQMWPDV